VQFFHQPLRIDGVLISEVIRAPAAELQRIFLTPAEKTDLRRSIHRILVLSFRRDRRSSKISLDRVVEWPDSEWVFEAQKPLARIVLQLFQGFGLLVWVAQNNSRH